VWSSGGNIWSKYFFLNPVACCFLYKTKDLSAPSYFAVHYYTHTHTSVQSCFHCRCLLMAPNGGRSPSSGSPKCTRPQLPASNSNSSQHLNPSVYLTTTQNQRQIYFTTDGLPPIISSWLQDPRGSRPEIFANSSCFNISARTA
jgi:hypothetical protein